MQPSTPTPSPEAQGQPDQERLPKPIALEKGSTRPEAAPASPEAVAPASDSVNQNAGAPAVPLPQPVATTPDPPPSQKADPQDMPAIADEADLIEKEWVKKAKQVVDKTREDPYEQTEQMGEVKKDYKAKRFGQKVKPAQEAG